MKRMTLVLVIALSTSTAFSKQLTVACAKQNPSIEDAGNSTIAAVMEVANINAKPVLRELVINGSTTNQGRVTDSALTRDTVQLYLQFGQGLSSSAKISLRDCQDSFSATGVAQYEKYVGGFAGTELSKLVCTCALK
jgi:hypothetical protein